MGELRYLTIFTFEVEAVHDEHPDYFANLIEADVTEAMRRRGCDDFTLAAWSWRDPTVPSEPTRSGGLWVAPVGWVGRVDGRAEWRPVR